MNIRILALDLGLIKNSTGIIKAVRRGKVSLQGAAKAFNPSNVSQAEGEITQIIKDQDRVNQAFTKMLNDPALKGRNLSKAEMVSLQDEPNNYWNMLNKYRNFYAPFRKSDEIKRPLLDVAKTLRDRWGSSRIKRYSVKPNDRTVRMRNIEGLEPLIEKAWGLITPNDYLGKPVSPGKHLSKGIYRYGYEPQKNVAKIPDLLSLRQSGLRETHPDLYNEIRKRIFAISRHEYGHGVTLGPGNKHRLRTIAAGIETPLLKTIKTEFQPKELAYEAAAQWRATKGLSFGAKAAKDLPIQKMQEVNPTLLENWKNEFARYPENIRDRLLATRAHLYLNYSIH